MDKQKKPQIIIEVNRGCCNLVSTIPEGVELVVKDYDIIEDVNSTTQKNDRNGAYEEAVYDSESNQNPSLKPNNKKK